MSFLWWFLEGLDLDVLWVPLVTALSCEWSLSDDNISIPSWAGLVSAASRVSYPVLTAYILTPLLPMFEVCSLL